MKPSHLIKTSIVLLLTIFVLSSCITDDEDTTAVEERIDSLASDINAYSYSSFINNFHSDSGFSETFTQSLFDDLTNSGSYNYSFKDCDITVNDDEANASCKADITDSILEEPVSSDLSTDFSFRKSGDDFLILTWTESGQTIWQKIMQKISQ